MGNNKLLNEMAEKIKTSNKPTEKQKKILEVAITAFADKGYANTSTSEIAKLAGVAEGTIFKHYGTKENLLLSIMVPFVKDFFPAMADEFLSRIMSDEISFEEFLRRFLKNRIAFFSDNREIFQVFIKEIIYKEELKQDLLPYILENGSVRLMKVLERFKQRGEIIDVPDTVILKMFSTFIGGFLISRFVLFNQPSISEEEVEEAVLFILNGIGTSYGENQSDD